ncbi:hypothetical protein BK640_15000 [Pseudomonas protegens]|nr:hypothetical protein BK639_04375 [Pseudomonas protegens]ROM03079.1 hypothetical protein BK640_15000 [Pseudomonas protegens]ROM08585.1 hypothetical protein BK641_06885 [Pseudomonas protegens]ROM12625.1 hypothetical protein BK642_04375 [Pseudomonas protegens]
MSDLEAGKQLGFVKRNTFCKVQPLIVFPKNADFGFSIPISQSLAQFQQHLSLAAAILAIKSSERGHIQRPSAAGAGGPSYFQSERGRVMGLLGWMNHRLISIGQWQYNRPSRFSGKKKHMDHSALWRHIESLIIVFQSRP